MDPLTIFAAFAPVVVDALKGLISRFITPPEYKPANITEYGTIKDLDLKLFTAMNSAGGSNPSYLWVEAVIRMQRPAVAGVVLSVWALAHLSGTPDADLSSINNFASAIGFYLFGDRTLFYTKAAEKR